MGDVSRSANLNAGFAALLKRFRTAAGLTQEELAERAGLSVRGISDLERGLKRRPHRETVRLLTAALNLSRVDAAAFLDASNPEETPQPDLLPVPTASLIGRDEAVREVVGLLRAGPTRLLTLTGPGGVGKTRLALEASAQARDGFPDGVAFVSLASVTSADAAPGTIARALGLRQTAGRPVRETLFAELRTRRALIVLDNCEQIPIGALVGELLARCPKLVILATSRAPLHVSGEQELPVAPLALPDPARLPPLDQFMAIPAVALFLARAAAVKPDFTLTTRNAAAIASICAKLDGLPLAIELAAARIKLLTPAALLDLLGDRFRLLTGGPQDAPERHQTMRAAIAWSESLLTEREKRAFRGLAAFSGGCALDDALAVLAPDDPVAGLDDLTGLIDQSLLRREDANEEEPRLIMLETIHEYAAEQLAASGEESSVRSRHAARFLDLAEEARPLLSGNDSTSWLDRVEREHGNLWVAYQWLLESGDTEQALRLASIDLWQYWWQRGRLREGRLWISNGLREATKADDQTLADAYLTLGNIHSDLGDYAGARAAYEQSIDSARRAGDRLVLSDGLHNLGNVLGYLGEFDRARELVEESVKLADVYPVPDRRRALALLALGDIAFCEGDFNRSSDFLKRTLEIVSQIGNSSSIAYAKYFYGRTLSVDEPVVGLSFLSQSLESFRSANDQLGTAYALVELGGLALADDNDHASELFLEALALSHALGSDHCTLMCVEGMAEVAANQRRWREGARLFIAAEAYRGALGRPLPAHQRERLARAAAITKSVLGNDLWSHFAVTASATRLYDLAQELLDGCPFTST
jgi:predicted ATPase/DNA-binding XRE family transcriptional regulator